MTLAILLFAAAPALIASERVDRTKVALAGMVAVLLTQTIDQEVAIEAIDWNTLGLLAGMMLMVKVTEPLTTTCVPDDRHAAKGDEAGSVLRRSRSWRPRGWSGSRSGTSPGSGARAAGVPLWALS